MRHFLQLPVSVGSLAGGVMHRPAVGFLVATPGTEERLLAGNLGAAVEAVDVASVTPGADPDLPPAPLAVVQPVALFHAPPLPEETGQRGRLGAISIQSESLLPQRPRRGPGEYESLGLRPSWQPAISTTDPGPNQPPLKPGRPTSQSSSTR